MTKLDEAQANHRETMTPSEPPSWGKLIGRSLVIIIPVLMIFSCDFQL